MKANRINAAAQTDHNVSTDGLTLRLRRTAMAGAAALALTGGLAAPSNAVAEVIDEVSVDEKKRTRFANVAQRFVTPDFVASRADRAAASRLLDEQRKRVAQANRDVTTMQTRSDTASEGLAEVVAGLSFWERNVTSPQRLLDAQAAKVAADTALTSAQGRLADEKHQKTQRLAEAANATLREALAYTKQKDTAQFRAETIQSLRDSASEENPTGETGDVSVPTVTDPTETGGTDTNAGNKGTGEATEQTETSVTDVNAGNKDTSGETVAEVTKPTESGVDDTNGGDVSTDGETEADTASEVSTPESGDADADANADARENPTAEALLEQPQVDPAVQAMASGVVLTQMANAAQQNADLFRKGMQDRLSGDDAFMQPTDIASATSGISTWAQAMGGQTTGQARGDVAGFSMRGAGMVAGIDAKKNNTRVGVAVGYGDASVDANGANSQNASSKVSTYSVGLYGAHEVDGWFANGGVSYSAHSIKSQRTAKLGGEVYGLSGKTSATTIGGFAQFGKHIVTRAVNIDPSVTLKVSNTSVKGFTEHGEAGLKVDGSQFNSARVGIGARLWKEFGDESHSITPSLRIAYERELAHAAPSMDVALANAANAGTMTVTGHKLGRDIVSAEAGIDVKFGKKLSLRGGVNGSLRQGQTQAGVAGSLKYVW